MFCSQCGARINDNSIFCAGCGAKVIRVQSQPQILPEQNPVQPQPQVQPQQAPVQPQPQVQPQQAPVQPQPQVQPQQAPMQPQPQVQPQQAPVQPQPQVQPQQAPVQPQPQMQPGQVPNVQPRPQMQPGQVPNGQPRPQMQPGQAPNGQPRPQMQPGQVPNGQPVPQANPPKKPKKKKSKVGLVIFLLLLFLAIIAGLVCFVIFSGILKSPKKLFAENVVGVSQNINSEIPSLGTIPFDAIFHIGIDDTTNSHTTTKTTSIVSDSMAEYSVEMEQSYSYNKDNGDAAYDLTFNVNGSSLGTGSMYFSGNDFIFVPINPNSSMVKYTMDSSAKEAFKDKDAIERYSLMLMEYDKQPVTDWDEELDNFTKNALEGLSKKDFKKSKAAYTILGEEKKCQTVALSVTGDEAVNLIGGLNDLIYSGIVNENEDFNSFKEFIDEYKENGSDLNITMTTYRYKKTPVAIEILVNSDNSNYKYDLSYYTKKSEKQFMFISTSPDGKTSSYEESVISTGIGTYKMTDKCDFGDFYILIEQDGQIVGTTRNLKGTIEIVSKKEVNETVASVAGNSINGTIEETVILGNGMKTTTLELEKGTISIISSLTREPLRDDKITPPPFIPESGVDVGTSLEDMKTIFNVNDTVDSLKIDNTLIHLFQVYYLMISKSGSMNFR